MLSTPGTKSIRRGLHTRDIRRRVTLTKKIVAWITHPKKRLHRQSHQQSQDGTDESRRIGSSLFDTCVRWSQYNVFSFQLTSPSVVGAETVVSSMSGILYWLLRPGSSESYSRLRTDVRSTYSSYESINYGSTQQLPYLQAAIREGLRTFSNDHPLPRFCPGRMIDGHWVATGVSRHRPRKSKAIAQVQMTKAG